MQLMLETAGVPFDSDSINDALLGGFSQHGSNHTMTSNSTSYRNSTGTSDPQFKALVERLLLEQTKGHRVSIIITAAFSLVASLIVILVVWHDARVMQKESISTKKRLVMPVETLTFTDNTVNELEYGHPSTKQRSCLSQLQSPH